MDHEYDCCSATEVIYAVLKSHGKVSNISPIMKQMPSYTIWSMFTCLNALQEQKKKSIEFKMIPKFFIISKPMASNKLVHRFNPKRTWKKHEYEKIKLTSMIRVKVTLN